MRNPVQSDPASSLFIESLLVILITWIIVSFPNTTYYARRKIPQKDTLSD